PATPPTTPPAPTTEHAPATGPAGGRRTGTARRPGSRCRRPTPPPHRGPPDTVREVGLRRVVHRVSTLHSKGRGSRPRAGVRSTGPRPPSSGPNRPHHHTGYGAPREGPHASPAAGHRESHRSPGAGELVPAHF